MNKVPEECGNCGTVDIELQYVSGDENWYCPVCGFRTPSDAPGDSSEPAQQHVSPAIVEFLQEQVDKLSAENVALKADRDQWRSIAYTHHQCEEELAKRLEGAGNVAPPARNAAGYLTKAKAEMEQRASSRDTPAGERSMGRCVAAFNALYGTAMAQRVTDGLPPLSETLGWQFMSTLKKARGAAGAYREDDYTDDVAYAALAAESAAACIQENHHG
ncbi:MAG: hypothetical protein JJU06_13350 [Ectothiorhodospiraceae bacterium]|nr:hypothetical protein [Ectothiorhodospiraceae bacterium]